MKYMASDFISELKEANGKRTNQCKNKKAFSMREEINNAADEILLVAENEREFYEKKDAKGAIEFSARQYMNERMSDFRDIIKEVKKKALKDLIKSWSEE